MTCECCIPTPESILEDDEIDVFEEIIPDTDAYYAIKRQALWDTYALRGIGSCDLQYWLKAMKRRYGEIKTVYDVKLKALQIWLTSVSGNVIDMSDSSSEYSTITENEDNPDNPQGSTRYISDRNTVTYNGKSYTGMTSESLTRFTESIPDIEGSFADEFKRLFYFGV